MLGGSAAQSHMTLSSGQQAMKKDKQFNTDVPDPNVLLAILNRKGKFDKDLKNSR